MDISIILYFPEDDAFTHCYSIWADLEGFRYKEVYKNLVNIAKAIGKELYYICAFSGDYRYMTETEIKIKCRDYYKESIR